VHTGIPLFQHDFSCYFITFHHISSIVFHGKFLWYKFIGQFSVPGNFIRQFNVPSNFIGQFNVCGNSWYLLFKNTIIHAHWIMMEFSWTNVNLFCVQESRVALNRASIQFTNIIYFSPSTFNPDLCHSNVNWDIEFISHKL